MTTSFLIFKCKRIHTIFDAHYQALVSDQYITIQKKSNKPKYNYQLNIDNKLYWFVQDQQIRGFGINYKNKVKFFEADPKDLEKLRLHCGAKILYDNIQSFYLSPKQVEYFGDTKVSKIEDSISHNQWGLKVLNNMSQFIFELNILSQLNHQNIVRVRECFQGQNFYYIIYEINNGMSLEQFIKKTPKITHFQIKNIIQQLLRAIDYLHNNGILHRDMKPSNILFWSKSETIKLIEFENAVLETQESYPYPTNATRSYLAPEVENSPKYSKKCDVFSCGAIMYRLYSGLKLFECDGSSEDDLNSLECQMINLPLLKTQQTPCSAIDLIIRMLDLNPITRISANEALKHSYFSGGGSLSPIEKRKRFQSQHLHDQLKQTTVFMDFEQDSDLDECDAHCARMPRLSVQRKSII